MQRLKLTAELIVKNRSEDINLGGGKHPPPKPMKNNCFSNHYFHVGVVSFTSYHFSPEM